MGLAILNFSIIAHNAALNAQEVSANVSISSDYFWRGVPQNAGNPAVSGSLEMDVAGLTVGAWASQVDFGDDETNLEYDLYASLGHTWGEFDLEGGLIHYAYDNSDIDALNEYFVGVGLGPVSAKYYRDLDGDAGYWEGSVSLPSVLGLMPSIQYGKHVEGLWDKDGEDFFALNMHKHLGDHLVARAVVYDFVDVDAGLSKDLLDGIALSVEYTF